MPVTQKQKDTSLLKPRVRIIKTIGEELISNDIVAIIEFVKKIVTMQILPLLK